VAVLAVRSVVVVVLVVRVALSGKLAVLVL
jgi:hypothetical protein